MSSVDTLLVSPLLSCIHCGDVGADSCCAAGVDELDYVKIQDGQTGCKIVSRAYMELAKG